MIEAIFEQHHKTVYRVCMLYLKNPADAEDITQGVFLRLLSKKPAFETSEHEKAWLVRTAINACKPLTQWHKNQQRRLAQQKRRFPHQTVKPRRFI